VRSKYHVDASSRNEHPKLNELKLQATSGRTYSILDATGLAREHEKMFPTEAVHVSVVVFVINAAEYDPVFEKESSTQLEEDLALFTSVCENSRTKDAQFVLWIDSMDRFRSKLDLLDLDKFISEYKAGTDMSKFIEHVPRRFEEAGRKCGIEVHTLYLDEGGLPPMDLLVLLLHDLMPEITSGGPERE